MDRGDGDRKNPLILLHPQRETFDYAFLPIPISNIAASNLTVFLTNIKNELRSTPIDAKTLAGALKIQEDYASLIIDTIESVLPDDARKRTKVDGARVVDVNDLVLFLYVQSYKRMVLSRIDKENTSVSDVWPTNSSFNRCLTANSTIQLARSNSRRFLPSQMDEEIHQLSYLQKHMDNVLKLLAEPGEGEDVDSRVLTIDAFEHLGLLIQFCKDGFEGISLQKAASFFSNSDQDKPTLSVPARQFHEWILQSIDASLEYNYEKVKEEGNDQNNSVDVGDTKSDNSHTSSHDIPSLTPYVIGSIYRTSVVKRAHDIKGKSVKVVNCHESVIYLLAPLRYTTVYGCSNATVVLGAVGKAVRIEHCERVHIIAATKRIYVSNCRECLLHLGINERPVFFGDNHKLQVAPYNTFYSNLNEHIKQVSLDVTINRWNEPLVLGEMSYPRDSPSHPVGIADVEPEPQPPTCLDPDTFTNFVIPKSIGGGSSHAPRVNPFRLPEKYLTSLEKQSKALDDVLETISDAQFEEKKEGELIEALHLRFRSWVYDSGNIRQMYSFQDDSENIQQRI